MLRFVLALQAMGEIPPDFDLKKVQPSVDSIVVTARRQNQRIDSAPVTEEPPLGRAEMELFGKVKGNVRVESQGMGNGTTSQRVMVGVKIPL
ncbi:MAG: hypothetical protein EPO45_11310 [Sphingobium sp.]|jgi:hypothetical protein|uniref:Uncharacterized protein n=1 Tax=Sphingobium xenophagum TaxID=121428 RepID=A0A401IXT1_SPHXE|nr:MULTISPECIES: hypothetical protein [Sphingobium]MBU0658169.1 hypothetical protein [Alphaproteobacteria bacterium]MBA4755212.1 hypothetical protein [Sphingobium sp.]MBS90338.1 hypothetical protein [Sphingobium sp.]MBU0776268.1 hypothetical protein [Alphaproteobacteria bacterium]MBU1796387.1 hypothetical protein [Alphaproteobacteria bacterium]